MSVASAALVISGLGVPEGPSSQGDRSARTAADLSIGARPGEAWSFDATWPDALAPRIEEALAARHLAQASGRSVRGWRLDTLEPVWARYDLATALPLSGEHEAGSGLGPRRDPLHGRWSHHEGLDVGCRTGEPVRAAADGEVVKAWRGPRAGRYVNLDHGEVVDPVTGALSTMTTRYLHLSALGVSTGDRVQAGETLGLCGSTGRSTGPHLHFELRLDDEPVAPFVRPADPAEAEGRARVVASTVARAGVSVWALVTLEGSVAGPEGRRQEAVRDLWLYEPADGASSLWVVVPDRGRSPAEVITAGSLATQAEAAGVAMAVVDVGAADWSAPIDDPGPDWCRGACGLPPARWVAEVVLPWLATGWEVEGVAGLGSGADGVRVLARGWPTMPSTCEVDPSRSTVVWRPPSRAGVQAILLHAPEADDVDARLASVESSLQAEDGAVRVRAKVRTAGTTAFADGLRVCLDTVAGADLP